MLLADTLNETITRLNNNHTCPICGRTMIEEEEHSAAPLYAGYCCEECNSKYVVPERIKAAHIVEAIMTTAGLIMKGERK